MKKHITLFFLLGAAFLAQAQDSAIVCGKIPEDSGKTFSIYKPGVQGILATSKIDSTGYFKAKLLITAEDFFNFSDSREFQTLYIHPGDSIYITLYPMFFDETATFSGKGSTESNILKRLFMIGEQTKSDYPTMYKELFQNPPKDLISRIEKIWDVKLSLLEDFQNDSTVSKEFIKIETERIKIDALYSLIQLEFGYKRFNRLYLSLLTDSLKNIHIYSKIPFDTALFSYSVYNWSVIANYLFNLKNKEFERDSMFYKENSYGIYAAGVKVIMDNEAFTPEFKDYCLYNRVKYYLSRNYTFEDLPAYYSDFKKYCHSDRLKKKIEKELEKNKAWIADFSKADSLLLKDKDFMNFTRSYFGNKTRNSLIEQGVKISGESFTKKELDMVNEKVSSQILKDYLYYLQVKNYLNFCKTNPDKSILKQFKKVCKTDTLKEKIYEQLNNLNKIKQGMPAPDFTCVDIRGKEHSLSDYKGQFVYIDIWATWCSPCKREIPFLDKLREEYKDKNIVFMSISVDNDKDKWKAMVKNDKMPGLQLYAPEAWKSTVATEYNVKFIPRFILVDETGKIISSNAKRPSGKIRETLDKYLK